MQVEKALTIAGAVAAALVAVADRKVVWAGGAPAPGRLDADAAVGVARGALALVELTDPDDEFGDVLITSAAYFHVLRLVRGPDGADLVACLVLRRTTASLALARHEFKMIANERGAPAAPAPAGEAEPDPDPGPAPAHLPRRRSGRNNAPPAAATAAVPNDWFFLLSQPFTTEDAVLDRILGTLRHL
ncbi:hypothetical protein [Mangrovihabitans endophyticus]|uniref:Uncharacterized protein n=1 Tax=Mangrovihabitans endophyticus TaxID=1751298 RepID=A0A8J3BWQ7_9ACTN|nr:hypothetical protein [Mangrovihabitans endophyticus]GGK84324.1 hypothetical protein GCM10012284_18170 [Mangrovihabitans endophyticus]